MSIVIPDNILQATKMTEDELKLEIAIMLYKQEKISSGKVCAWTGLTVIEFQHELAKRGLYINYDVEDFQLDVKTLQLLGLLWLLSVTPWLTDTNSFLEPEKHIQTEFQIKK